VTYPELNPGYGKLPDAHRHSICQLHCSYGGGALPDDIRIGTGFLYAASVANAHIATAAHLLFHHDLGEHPARIVVGFGRHGPTVFRQATLTANVANRCHIPDEFLSGGDGASDFDFGLLKIAGNHSDLLTIPCSLAEPNLSKVKLIGYPSEDSDGSDPFHAILEVEVEGRDNFNYVHQITYEGMSGGPLLGRTRNDNQTIKTFGLHVRGEGNRRAIRFSREVQARLKSWVD
jgi:V8-like Glu-specific endopeptidase